MTDNDAQRRAEARWQVDQREKRMAKLQSIVQERLKEQAKVTADRVKHPAFFKGGDYA